MFLGMYWSRRPESREQAAKRLTSFLEELRISSEKFASWFFKGWSRKEALECALKIDVTEIAKSLRVNRTDVGRTPIPELGYSLSIWNGQNADLEAHIGSVSAFVANSVVLSLNLDVSSILSDDGWRRLMQRAIIVFEPDDAVIVSDRMQAHLSAVGRWETAWLTYRREAGIEDHPERR